MHPIDTNSIVAVQQKIFRYIDNYLERESPYTLVNIIQDLLNIGKTAAYNKIYARSPLKLSELLSLIQKYNLKMEEFLPGYSPTDVSFNHSKNDLDFEGYFNHMLSLNKELTAISRAQNYHICLTDPGIPDILLAPFPELLLFSFYSDYIFYGKANFNEKELHYFQNNDKRFGTIQNALSETFNSLEAEIIIGKNPFNILLSKINYLYDMLLLDKGYALRMLQHLQQLLKALKNSINPEIAAQDEQVFRNKKILICETLALNSTCLIRIEEAYRITHNVMTNKQLESFSLRYGMQVEEIIGQIKKHSWDLSGASLSGKSKFFSSIRENIQQTEKKIRENA